jgi:hypothetical protein
LRIVYLPDEFRSIGHKAGKQIGSQLIILGEGPLKILVCQPIGRSLADLAQNDLIAGQGFMAMVRQDPAQA